jgi:NADPH:quinone reductase-like Zn-dependent oxidoreductase
MRAAVVHSYDQPPSYRELPEPTPGPGQLVLDVLASALHPLVRGRASGKHYSTANTSLPVVPGVDGVGRLADGRIAYFTSFGPGGSMAERVAVDEAACWPLSDRVDPATLAASVNPGMSGWVALRAVAGFRPGEKVLVLGATGAAGRAAVRLAHHLGAAGVVAAGRDPDMLAALPGLGADATVSLNSDQVAEELVARAADTDIVIDYLWGEQTERALAAIIAGRPDAARPLRWVEVGAIAGSTIRLPGAALRGSALRLLGSGLGSVSPAVLDAELGELLVALADLPPTTQPAIRPLREVEQAWLKDVPAGKRTVFVP